MKKVVFIIFLALASQVQAGPKWTLSLENRQPAYRNTGQVKEWHLKRGVGAYRFGGGRTSRFHYRATRGKTGGGGSRIIKKAQ